MPVRKASAVWEGTLKEGKGTVKTASGVLSAPYSFSSRFEEGSGTNPEELIGAAHAGCYSMALSLALTEAGHPPTRIETTASVSIVPHSGGFKIDKIDLVTNARVPGIDNDTFLKLAEDTKYNCPVSGALQGPQINLSATLS
ncbi:OsmC family protein [Salinispira pacifica]